MCCSGTLIIQHKRVHYIVHVCNSSRCKFASSDQFGWGPPFFSLFRGSNLYIASAQHLFLITAAALPVHHRLQEYMQ